MESSDTNATGNERCRPACIGPLLLALLLSGCSSSPSDKAEQQAKTAASASATVLMALDARLAGAAPLHYTQRTLEAMQAEIGNALKQIDKAAPSAPGGADLEKPVGDAADALKSAKTALDKGDTVAIELARQDLQAAAENLARSRAVFGTRPR